MRNALKTKTWQRTKTPGLLRHKGGRYYGRFTLAGKTKFVALETTIFEVAAHRFAQEKARVEATRRAARESKAGSGRMKHYVDLYRADVQADATISETTRKRYLEHIAYIETTWPGFGDLRPDAITIDTVRAWRSRALSLGSGYRPRGAKGEATFGRSPGTFNKSVQALRRMLARAVRDGALHHDPLAGPKGTARHVKAKERPRKPQLPEMAKLHEMLAAMESIGGRSVHAADFCRGLMLTGCRKREGAALTWANIDFRRGLVTVPGTKTDAAAREVPLAPQAREFFERLLEKRKASAMVAVDGQPYVAPTDRVFRVSEASKSLARACEAVGIPKLGHHELRDAFATACIESGVDVPTVARWLGHADNGALLLRVYAHHRRQHSIEQAKKVQFGGAP